MLSRVVSGAALAVVMLVETAPAGVGTVPTVFSRAAGTWGACGSWWSDTATEMTSGSVCGIDGLVAENGVATQLAEPFRQTLEWVRVYQGSNWRQSDAIPPWQVAHLTATPGDQVVSFTGRG